MNLLCKSIISGSYFIYLLLILFNSTVCAQYPNSDFEHISVEHGLSQGVINCIMQDSKGFLWFGTNDGLTRYDGYTFKVFRNIPDNLNSISDNTITSITEDINKNIWIGTSTGYLNKYNPITGKFIYYKIQLNVLFPDFHKILRDVPPCYAGYNRSSITSIYCDNPGFVWAGSFGNGLFRFNPDDNSFKHYFYTEGENTISSNFILSLCGDNNGAIWAATFTGGLNKITRNIKNKKEVYDFTVYNNLPEDKKSFPDKRVTSVLFNNDNLWVGTFGSGLVKLNFTKDKKPVFSTVQFNPGKNKIDGNNRITKVVSGKNGNLWIGTFGSGLQCFNPVTGKYTDFEHDPSNPFSIDDDDIISLAVDRTGLIWAGTLSGFGVNKLNPFKIKFVHYKSEPSKKTSLSDNTVTSFAEDKNGDIWIGTYKGGLNKFLVDKNEFKVFSLNQFNSAGTRSNYITSLFIDKNNNIWIGTYNNGLIIFDPVKNKTLHFLSDRNNGNYLNSNQITSIIDDNDSSIWIGTTNGGLNKVVFDNFYNLNFISYKYSEIFSEIIPNNNIIQLFKDNEGKLWLTTREGYLCRLNDNYEDFSSYRIYESNENPAIDYLCIYEDSDNNFWLGTNGAGLQKFNKNTNTFTSFINPNGLKGKIVAGILPDNKDNLWLSTNFGLLKYNIKSNSVTTYNLNDGIQSLQFTNKSYIKSKNGKLYFGGINGFNSFSPDSINFTSFKPAAEIISFRAGNVEIPNTDQSINLSSSENSIEIEFTVMDFSDPSKNQYFYKLDGYDKDWNYSTGSDHMAVYNHLLPGEYMFRLRAANSYGIWNDNEIFMKIIITGPFWRSWWFILIIVLIITGIAAYLVSLKVFQYLEVEKLKTKLSADLHDSVGSGLTEISMLCEIIKRDLKHEPEEIRQRLQMIADRSRTLIDNMSDIVWLVNPKPNTLYDLVLRLKDIYSPILYSLGTSFNTDIPESLSASKISMEKRQNIYLIFKEAINNSIKYSFANEIKFTIGIEEGFYNINLKDNGCGFDGNNIKPGNGLINMKKRAESIQAEISINSIPGKGTIIVLRGRC